MVRGQCFLVSGFTAALANVVLRSWLLRPAPARKGKQKCCKTKMSDISQNSLSAVQQGKLPPFYFSQETGDVSGVSFTAQVIFKRSFLPCIGLYRGFLGVCSCVSRLEQPTPSALTFDETSNGPNHPTVATGLNNLAALLCATNRAAEAEPLSRRSVEILLQLQQQTGQEHPHFRALPGNYRRILESRGDGRSRDSVAAAVAAPAVQSGINGKVATIVTSTHCDSFPHVWWILAL